jgi:anti-sigma B factor antagonist
MPIWECSTICSMTVAVEGETHIVRLAGELDLADADRVHAALVDGGGRTVIVDLSGLVFLDARGLSALVTAQELLRGAGDDLRIVGARGSVHRVFAICGLIDRLDPA